MAARCATHTSPAWAGPLPRVQALHLPPDPEPGQARGEFCALALEDGSLGLSYVLLDDTLAQLRQQDASLGLAGADALTVARRFASGHGAHRAIGLAAANALTRCLFDRAAFRPPESRDSLGALDPQPGDHIGMIGLFTPLLPRVLASGAALTVVELKAQLAGPRDGYRVTLDAARAPWIFWLLVLGSAVTSHAPKHFRHWPTPPPKGPRQRGPRS